MLTASPAVGPLQGNTRVTIFGDGFQAPVQVTFFTDNGSSETEARVIEVQFDRILVLAPTASEINVIAGQPVHIRVRNIQSGAEAVMRNAFRYRPTMEITSVSPQIGCGL